MNSAIGLVIHCTYTTNAKNQTVLCYTLHSVYKTFSGVSRHARGETSLVWPDHLRTGTYRLEIISAAPRGSGILHSIQIF